MSAALQEDADILPPFERAFLRAVLEYRGMLARPTIEELAEAMQVLSNYTQQRQDNPPSESTEAWLARLSEENRAALAAHAFLEYGATKPTPGQWQLVHRALYGPLLCTTCE